MDTIRNYLDNMFMNMPKDARTLKAKQDLLNMMEDKYNELKSQGKTENEAIGVVISEFGNIEEVLKELEISVNTGSQTYDSQTYNSENINGNQGMYGNQNMNGSQGVYGSQNMYNSQNSGSSQQDSNSDSISAIKVTKQTAMEYMDTVKKAGKKIALGVALCILSPVVLILLGGMNESSIEVNGRVISEASASAIGVGILLMLVAAAVALFINNAMKLSKYEYLKKDILVLDAETEKKLRDQREHDRSGFSKNITVGVVICIIAVIPVVMIGCMYENNDFYACIDVAVMLVFVSIAVHIFVTSGLNWGTYNVLLQEEDYTKNKKEGKDLTGNVAQIYWPVVVCIYLIWSFLSKGWGYTWIVWPVAGVLFGAIACICNIIGKK